MNDHYVACLLCKIKVPFFQFNFHTKTTWPKIRSVICLAWFLCECDWLWPRRTKFWFVSMFWSEIGISIEAAIIEKANRILSCQFLNWHDKNFDSLKFDRILTQFTLRAKSLYIFSQSKTYGIPLFIYHLESCLEGSCQVMLFEFDLYFFTAC